MALLLFARLGHYALWDDEAVSALDAEGVMRTGDSSILMDYGNIVAYRNGSVVQDFKDRVDPPFPNYLTAASFEFLRVNALAGRLPYALLGLATAGLILYWARKERISTLVVLILGLCGNVSLILYCRQCRYYALSVFLSTAIVYIYWRWKPTPPALLAMAGCSSLLFASHYLNYIALYLCLAVDYVLWQRKIHPPNWRMALFLFGPQVIVNGLVGFIWNPMRTQYGSSVWADSLWDRLTLFCWYWRDANQCEFLALPIFLLALVIGFYQRRFWLVRGCVAMVVFIATISLISPQSLQATSVADLRYLVPIIPLAIALETGALCGAFSTQPLLAVAAAVLVFGTNLFNGGPLFNSGFRSTFLSYTKELLDPPPDPYTLTAAWINQHVPEGKSIWVLPDYAVYPLMFHAPRALYAWQLDWPPRKDFASLPRIHFMKQEPPDYLIAFGPFLGEMAQTLAGWNQPGIGYTRIATIDIFWKDLYRPELFWRRFEAVKGYDPNTQAIYIYQRTGPATR